MNCSLRVTSHRSQIWERPFTMKWDSRGKDARTATSSLTSQQLLAGTGRVTDKEKGNVMWMEEIKSLG